MLANHELISIFELGLKGSKSVTTETFGGVSQPKKVTTETCRHWFGSDKRGHIILQFRGNKHNISTIMQFFCILVCFSSVLVCELKFCNVMRSLPKHFCHY